MELEANERFELAVDAVVGGDLVGLKAMLREYLELVRMRSTLICRRCRRWGMGTGAWLKGRRGRRSRGTGIRGSFCGEAEEKCDDDSTGSVVPALGIAGGRGCAVAQAYRDPSRSEK